MGAWKPKKHKVLVGRNAKLLTALGARGMDRRALVHTLNTCELTEDTIHMNERADGLAAVLGVRTTTHFRAGRPLRRGKSYQYTSSYQTQDWNRALPHPGRMIDQNHAKLPRESRLKTVRGGVLRVCRSLQVPRTRHNSLNGVDIIFALRSQT